ncbi:MAG: Fe-only nitrogenase subunit delta [Chlorobiaceae bacterium]|nr:Fe-only nitrogenase subunit delta [Chlorobiaceae bacterium]
MPDINEKVAQLENFIMKKCLWQFHSRAWDRKRQNENILGMATKLLCGEEVDTSKPEDKCYWVDASYLADSYREKFDWLSTMSDDEIRELMLALKARIDFVTVDGSLNAELTDPRY